MMIKIPAPVEIVANLATGEKSKDPYTFARHFVCNTLLLDPAWNRSGMAGLYMAMALRGLFLDAREGDLIEVSIEQQKALRDRLESPEVPLPMALAIQLKSYYDAIVCPHST